jgi:hypothetical protein
MPNKQISLTIKWLLCFLGISIVLLIVWYACWVSPEHRGIKSFISNDKHLTFIGIYFTIIMPLFQVIVQLIYYKRTAKHDRKQSKYLWDISLKHKEKVNILEKFGGNIKYNYLGGDSIYGTMIDILERIKNSSDNDTNKKQLFIFLCSPVLDTPERVSGDYQKWGKQFSDLITELCRKPNMKDNVHICFLSDDVKLGFRPLHGFIEVLANYCADFEKRKIGNRAKATVRCQTINHDTIYNAIEKQTTNVYGKIIAEHGKEKVRLLDDIPFQMIISETDNFAEVVVSFAGKTILEYEKEKEPKGFHSIDPDVVNAFKQIFDAYANKENRTPLKPQHTENIIKECKTEHTIKEYHYNTLPNILSQPIEISAKTFSPFYANSSKFTTDTLLHILKKDDKVIEIGSGSGIQVLAAYKKLQNLSTTQPVVWAIEPFAVNLLKINIKNTNIISKQWILRVKNGNNKGTHHITQENNAMLCDREKCTQNKCTENRCAVAFANEIKNADFANNKFNIVLGDLPFVSADTKNATDEQMAYYDLHHDTHRTLLRLFSKDPYDCFEKNAILITAFSTLGGYEDTSSFAQMIQDEGLVIVQSFCYLEDKYHWLIYCLMKKTDFEEANTGNKNYWKDRFGIIKA